MIGITDTERDKGGNNPTITHTPDEGQPFISAKSWDYYQYVRY